ncbi:related to SPC3 - signal peptidase subunit [Cephalotrichum gorgonifer]|uniref:Signal peptidase subunit 3 n=1 Tax=Cephalotrichum gorgonifer TaxID=2041049 RepID=A0AAE8SRE1_9PEZI|nr:related to SPC3 - signal peptidase subunit [Cephalotrichum gorgonifer]
MHNALTRVQNTFGLFTTTAFIVGILVALSDFIAPRTPSGVIKPNELKVVMGRPHYYSPKKEEHASIRFSLDADLSSLFNWNTKQVFVYVTAEWPESDGSDVMNSVVIWDSIITAPSSDHLSNVGPATMKKLKRSAEGKSIDPSRGLLKLKNQRPKYQVTHPSGKIANLENVKLRLHYSVQPWVGILTWNQDSDLFKWSALKGAVSKAFSLPSVKAKN